MLCSTVPALVRKVSDTFKDQFEGDLAQYRNYCTLLCLFLFGLRSFSDAARSFVFSPSVSELSRAAKSFEPNRFMRRLRRSILRKHGDVSAEDFIYAVDDTGNPRFGKTVPRSGTWGGSSGVYQGQKILVVALVNLKTGAAFPVAYAFNTKKDDPDYVNALELAGQLLGQLLEEGFPKLTVVADSWFGNAHFMSVLKSHDLPFVLEIKLRTRGKLNPGINVPYQRLPQLFKGRERTPAQKSGKKRVWCAKSIVYLKSHRTPLAAVAVYNRKNGKSPFAIYASSINGHSAAAIWKLSRARWKIECLFRNLKQEFGFGRLPGQGQSVADLAVCFPFALYVAVLHEQDSMALLGKETVGRRVKEIRSNSLSKAIPHLINNASETSVVHFLHRRTGRSLTQKPVNKAAEAS